MTDQELQEALAPVQQYHRAAHVSPNTVLAAHLRALGVNPVGPTWAYAKYLLEDGLSFAEAAREAVVDLERPTDNPPDQEAIDGVAPPEEREAVEPHDFTTVATVMDSTPSPHLAAFTRRSTSPYMPPGHGNMQWFPKVFGPGDIDGKGAARLLGTPNVPLSTVLIRETAQNSWDARLGHRPVVFTVHLRTLSDLERQVLRERVFTGAGAGLSLHDSLNKPDLRVLEVSDRGTKGLGGPVRNDVEPPLKSPTNYIDLVLNVGAPRDVHLGGGTYGFGKTISYRVSRAGTVLMWSRTVHQNQVQDRLIGSAIGESFALDGIRYTGRHWWGAIRDDGARVEPWTGDDADVLASSVFDSAFTGDETGTSLMIIDPNLGGEDDADDVVRLSEAILWNLWPKLLPNNGQQPMQIELYFDGQHVPLPDIETHPILSGYAEALQLVRATQDGTTYTPQFNSKVLEVRSYRPPTLVGHLALTRYPIVRPLEGDERDTVPVSLPSRHVAWMRHDAELVVRYDEKARLDSEVLHYAAVFKPVEEHDDRFASAEPPAHDDWVPASIEDRRDRSIVNVGLNRIKELINTELAPAPVTKSPDASTSVAALADSLSRLIGAVPGSKPQRSSARTGGGSTRRKKARAQVIEWERSASVAGHRTYTLLVALRDASEAHRVLIDVGVATDGPRLHADELVEVLGWAPSRDSAPTVSTDAPFVVNERRWLHVRAAAGVGIDVSLTCEEV